MERSRNNLNILLYFFVGFSVLQLLLLVLDHSDDFVGAITDLNFVITLATFLLVGVSTILIVLRVRDELKEKWYEFRLNLKKYLFMVLLFFLLIYLAQMIWIYVMTTFNLFEQIAEEQVDIGIVTQILQVFTLIILTPVLEEVVFRKTLVSMVSDKTNWFLSILLVNSFFSIMHGIGMGIPFFLLYLVIGVLLSLAYKISKDNIIVVILIHALLNISFVVL